MKILARWSQQHLPKETGWLSKLLYSLTIVVSVMLIAGCTQYTQVKVFDNYAEQQKKGYVLLIGRYASDINEKEKRYYWLPTYQSVSGRRVRLGGDWSGLGFRWGRRKYDHLLVAAPPGKETFYIDSKIYPFSVDVYECMTTRVTVVLSEIVEKITPSYKMSFEVDDPVKGKNVLDTNYKFGYSKGI